MIEGHLKSLIQRSSGKLEAKALVCPFISFKSCMREQTSLPARLYYRGHRGT